MKYLISTLLCIVSCASFACGGGYDEDYYHYNFLDYSLYEEAIGQFEIDGMYHHGNGGLYLADNDNLDAWYTYFGKKATLLELAQLVYKVPLDDLLAIKKGGSGKSLSLENSTVVPIWKKGKKIEALDYLIYAKRCQKPADYESSWYYERDIDQENFEKLIDDGLVLMDQTRSKEIKLRLAYQLVRMAHYSGKFELAVELFEKYLKGHKSGHVIYYYALEQLGGVFRKLGRPGEAAYTFSRVFALCPSRREVALRSYQFSTNWPDDHAYDHALKRCKNDQERADLYLIHSIRERSFIPELLPELYKIEPTHPMILGLMYSDLERLEGEYLDKGAFPSERTDPIVMDERLKFIRLVIEDGERTDIEHFKYMEAYLRFMMNDWKGSEQALSKVENTEVMRRHISSLYLLLQLAQLEQVTSKEEEHFLKMYNNLGGNASNGEIKTFWLRQFKRLYEKQDMDAKAFLCFNGTRDFINAFSPHLMRKVLNYLNQPDHSDFDRMLIGDLDKQKAYLYECLGTYYFRKDRLDSAKFYYKQVNVAYGMGTDDFWFQPSTGYPKDLFYSRSDDWEDGVDRLSIIDETKYQKSPLVKTFKNRLEVVEHIEFLKKYAIDARGEEKATTYYLLGNLWYNMSGEGYYRRVLNYGAGWYAQYESGESSEYYYYGYHYGEQFEYDEMYYNDNSRAYDYYLLTEKHTQDDEMKAKAAFGQAKCQGPRIDPYGNVDVIDVRGFEKLQNLYRNTSYYQEVIAECGYFEMYVNE